MGNRAAFRAAFRAGWSFDPANHATMTRLRAERIAALLLRAHFLVDVHSHTKITGQPLFAAELEQAIVEAMA